MPLLISRRANSRAIRGPSPLRIDRSDKKVAYERHSVAGRTVGVNILSLAPILTLSRRSCGPRGDAKEANKNIMRNVASSARDSGQSGQAPDLQLLIDSTPGLI